MAPPSFVLSAYAEDPGRKPGDECVGRTLRSSTRRPKALGRRAKSEGG